MSHTQTRRLHVSGLTPAISVQDLSARFAVFGTVKAIDGLGKLDATGHPRKFAFVSLEASNDKHAKCLNVLSGSTWKGAKLRIGEAKPDYAQRLEKERLQEVEPKFKRRRIARGVHGIESKTMSIVTPDNIESRSGWKRTTLSHLVFPLRMRPLHPIDRPQNLTSASLHRKKKKITPVTRARRQKIDPTRYGAIHLTEEMLQAEHVVISKAPETSPPRPVMPETAKPKQRPRERPVETSRVDDNVDLTPPLDAYQAEKQKDLSLLAQLFNGQEEWTGKEDDVEVIHPMSDDGDYDEDTPMGIPPEASASEEPSESEESGGSDHSSIHKWANPVQVPTTTRLKDLFSTPVQAPTSILAGLDLDLSLDEDLAFDATSFAEPLLVSITREPVHTGTNELRLQPKRNVLEGLQISSTVPLFFPLARGERSKGAAKDIMAISQARGWTDVFMNPPTSEETKRRWELEKMGLTRDWKQRHREACKRLRHGSAFNGLE